MEKQTTPPQPTSKVELNLNRPIWDRMFTVHPLVVVGSTESNGCPDMAPKHLAMPMGHNNYFGFICTPRHGTYGNIKRTGVFTVSFPYPNSVLTTSLTAVARCDDNTKPELEHLAMVEAQEIEGMLLRDAYLHLECKVHRFYDDFGDNSLITGLIVAARIDESFERNESVDDNDLIYQHPLLAYLAPTRFAAIKKSQAFPYPKDFKY